MSSKKTFILIAFTAAILMAFGLQNFSEHKVLLEKAKFTMETKGDLKGAIKLFEEIIEKYPDEREYAAKSQLYIGLCYEKLGTEQAKQAQKAFQKVIDNYPQQTETVKVAQEKLSNILKAQAVVEKGDKEFKITKIHTEKRREGLLSPDGKKLTLIDYTNAPGQIYLRDIASGKEIRLTDDLTEILDGVWSPDGKMIAYINLAWDVCVISTKVGPSKTIIKADPESEITGDILWPNSWTSDSKKLLFQVPSKGLFAIPASGGDWEEIFTFKDPEEAKKYKGMKLSPDGKLIAYNSTQGGNKDIYVMSVESGESIRITDNNADDGGSFWSYDGKWLAFYSTRTGNSEIWVKRINSDGKPKGEAIQVTHGGARGGTWTQDGKIAYFSSKGIVHVYTSNVDGSEEEQITKFKEGVYPRWSPDGKNIVFVAMDKEMKKRAIWIVPSKGGDEKHLTFGEFPIWSSDGKKIAFNDHGENQFPFKAVLSVIPAERGERKELMVYDGFLRNLDWSPDGRFIAFSYSRGENAKNPIPDSRLCIEDIYIIPADGGEPKRITKMDRKGYKFTSPRWSPDGKKIAFRSLDYEKFVKEGKWEPIEIWTIDVEDGETKLITKGLDGWELCWSPDGKYIISSRHEKESEETWTMDHWLYKVSAEGGEPEELNILGRMPDFSPDGKKIVFSRRTEAGVDFWLVENFLPEEKTKKKSKSN